MKPTSSVVNIMVDAEYDGPAPGTDLYSLVSFGAVVVKENVERTYQNVFYGQTRPISDRWDPRALAISGHTREEHLGFPDPEETFRSFRKWIEQFKARPVFVSDNPAADWQWINHYFIRYFGLNGNPFGHSGRRVSDFYAGIKGDWRQTSGWKKHRRTIHTHNPVDDAIGNVEALVHLAKKYNVTGVLYTG